MKASDFDKAFDDGEDISSHLDLKSARRPNQDSSERIDTGRIHEDCPVWAADVVDGDVDR